MLMWLKILQLLLLDPRHIVTQQELHRDPVTGTPAAGPRPPLLGSPLPLPFLLLAAFCHVNFAWPLILVLAKQSLHRTH